MARTVAMSAKKGGAPEPPIRTTSAPPTEHAVARYGMHPNAHAFVPPKQGGPPSAAPVVSTAVEPAPTASAPGVAGVPMMAGSVPVPMQQQGQFSQPHGGHARMQAQGQFAVQTQPRMYDAQGPAMMQYHYAPQNPYAQPMHNPEMYASSSAGYAMPQPPYAAMPYALPPAPAQPAVASTITTASTASYQRPKRKPLEIKDKEGKVLSFDTLTKKGDAPAEPAVPAVNEPGPATHAPQATSATPAVSAVAESSPPPAGVALAFDDFNANQEQSPSSSKGDAAATEPAPESPVADRPTCKAPDASGGAEETTPASETDAPARHGDIAQKSSSLSSLAARASSPPDAKALTASVASATVASPLIEAESPPETVPRDTSPAAVPEVSGTSATATMPKGGSARPAVAVSDDRGSSIRRYSKQMLTDLFAEDVAKPDDLLDMTVQSSGKSGGGPRKLGPSSAGGGGDDRWGRGGVGGGALAPGPKLWERGRASSNAESKAQGGAARTTDSVSQWTRGAVLPPTKGQTAESAGPVGDLQRSENRWVAKQIASGVEATTKKVQGVLNKMTRQTFEKLSGVLAEFPIESSEALKSVITLVFEKAIDDISRSVSFGEMYADLCVRLSEATRSWSFLRPVYNEDESNWLWSVDATLDEQVAGPFSSLEDCVEAARSAASASADEAPSLEPVAEGTQVFELRILKGHFIKILKLTKEDAKEYFMTWQPLAADLASMELHGGPFASADAAMRDAAKKQSFKRILLNKCQEEFEKVRV